MPNLFIWPVYPDTKTNIITRKKKRSVSLMNMDTKIINIIFINRI